MKSKLFALMLLAGGSLFAETHFSIGVGFGAPGYYPAPAPVVVSARPPCPGPDYDWVNAYYAPNGAWVQGYWAPRARYYAPRQYFQGGGYWRDGYWDRDDRYRDRGRDREWREHERREHERHEHDRDWRR